MIRQTQTKFDQDVTQAIAIGNMPRDEDRTQSTELLATVTPLPVLTQEAPATDREQISFRVRVGLGGAALAMLTTREWIPVAGQVFDTVLNR